MEEYLQVGVITNTHGIRGEVKVFPTTDDAARFKKLKQVLMDTGNGYQEMEIEHVKFFKQFVILKFKGYDSINEIERYKQKSLLVDRAHAVKLKKNEYFIADLIGLSVYTEDGGHLGLLKDVLQTGANDVYVVEMEDKKEVLIPAIRECILEVNMEERNMQVHLLKGLL
ncbi:MAG: 16S rRNA processing protein RimM [Lachnospiraceae bacterium]|jgi:16S rRNA processing protein RimM|uniref:16S rRNA processing protein RimM n=1 Tax=Hominisplanchenecus murintestinalis TaxID=2941517 RepID=A0AC61R1P2_9FIRM|nr:ribosome maturation factor RimM [Hominisplanchenecus murintestinalis]MCI9516107.1 16S rRNA processing protein RimM [Lachnospiraceae bacterium]RKJ97816.1 16S rRNA processing protein RimM [Anaerotruncus sp. 1XD22-93]MCI9660398.1 16S rRNA processing protein RimM [Lachnospiraceae bacterium]MDE6907593.1 ribosome maturation factor RimM [Lachnospiraceae bacterium]NBH97330.1 16S rRNA processing protein RimM [Lachnospiraceae bacterium]